MAIQQLKVDRHLKSLPDPLQIESDIILEKDGKRTLKDISTQTGLTFKKILRGINRSGEPFELIKKYMDLELRTAYEEERTRTGAAWEDLKESTHQRKERGGYGSKSILVRKNKMMKATVVGELKGGRSGFLKGRAHALLYDPAKKLGRTGRKFNSLHVHQKGSVKNGTPARPFLGLTIKDERVINRIFRNWAVRNLRKT